MHGRRMSAMPSFSTPRTSIVVMAPCSFAAASTAAASGPSNAGIRKVPPTCTTSNAPSAERSTSFAEKTAFAPITCKAGRSPFGRMGSMVAEVGTSTWVLIPDESTPYRSRMPRITFPSSSSPVAPMLLTSAPSLARSTAVPPAVPATVTRISSISAMF